MRRLPLAMLVCAVALLLAFAFGGRLPVRHGDAAQALAAAVEPSQKADAEPRAVRIQRPSMSASSVRLEGRIFDAMGYLVAGAEVDLGGVRARTDADGRFLLAAAVTPAAPSALLRIAADGLQQTTMLAWPQAGEPVFAALEPRTPWSGPDRVAALPVGAMGEGFVRKADGSPVEAALVTVLESGAMARTDATGRYEVLLQQGSNTLLVQHDGGDLGLCARSEPIRCERAQGRMPVEELVVAEAAAIRGVVRTREGVGQAGVPVQVRGQGFQRAALSGEGGVFRFAGLPLGDYEVSTFAHRGRLGAAPMRVAAAATATCELQLRDAPEHRIRVVDEAGAPVAAAVVAAKVDGLLREVARTDASGAVVLRTAAATPEFDVREADGGRRLRVVDASLGEDRLVVAMP